MDAMRAAELLIDKIKRDYPGDIAFVVMMGSRIYQDTHAKSDLDLYYVAKTKRGENLAFTFIVDGVGFDFWCVPVERLERMANYEDSKTSIVAEGQLLYAGSEEDRQEFERLRRRALDVSDRWGFVQKARKQFQAVYEPWFRLQQAKSLHDARMAAFGVLYPLTWSIALLNRDMVRRGRAKLKGELLRMPLLPEQFSQWYDRLLEAEDPDSLKEACGKLIASTDCLIRSMEEQCRPKTSLVEKLTTEYAGLYEEMINFYNKIEHFCEIGEYAGALFAAVELTDEYDRVFEATEVSSESLPDMVSAYDPKHIGKFLETVRAHHRALLELLRSKGVPIREFSDFEELACFLNTL